MVSSLSTTQQVSGATDAVGILHSQLSSTQRTSSCSSLQTPFTGLRRYGLRVCRNEFAAIIPRFHTVRRLILAPVAATAAAPPTSTTTIPSLNDLPLNGFINTHGRITPTVDPDTQASIFAVLDKNKKVQYIGFSKDLRNSLRILMGRRPEFCYFYKVHNFPALEQAVMMQAREQWMSELGAPPAGNSDPTQRNFWEKPADAGSISERGRMAAAKAKAKTLLQMLADRGITEEMVYDPKLLEEGKCDILPTKQAQGDLDQGSDTQADDDENPYKRKSVSIKAPAGRAIEYDIVYEMKFKTNGGWMYDIAITRDQTLTRHRVIVGSMFPEAVNMPEDDFLEVVMAFLLSKKIPRHTEGVLDANTFPINYFGVAQVCQFYKDFNDWFPAKLPDNFWRFMRTELYGPAIDPPPEELGPEEKVSIYE